MESFFKNLETFRPVTLLKRDSSTDISTAQKMKFPVKDFFSKCDQISQETADLVTLTEESLEENFIFCVVFPANIAEILRTAFFTEHSLVTAYVIYLNACQRPEADAAEYWKTLK